MKRILNDVKRKWQISLKYEKHIKLKIIPLTILSIFLLHTSTHWAPDLPTVWLHMTDRHSNSKHTNFIYYLWSQSFGNSLTAYHGFTTRGKAWITRVRKRLSYSKSYMTETAIKGIAIWIRFNPCFRIQIFSKKYCFYLFLEGVADI